MKDLISLDTAVNDFLGERKRPFCNYKKMLQLAQLLHQVTNLAKHKPEIVPKKDLVNMLRVCFIQPI